MPANVEVRGDTYYYRGKIAGKVHRVSTGYKIGSRRALELATRRAREIETEIRAGADGYVKKEIPTFKTWAAQFLAAYYPGKDDIYNTEALLMRRPAVRWAERRLDAITRTDVELYFRERQAIGAKGGTLERERVLMKRCFTAAVDDGLITVNPLKGLRAFKTEARTRVMTLDEETKLRAALIEAGLQHWDRFIVAAVNTGLRMGELMGACPADLRENGTWLWVRPELNKTRTGRMVPLREEARKALAEQAAARGIEEHPDRLYWGCHKKSFQKTLKRHCVKLKFDSPISIHDLRRTFATRCAAAKMYPRHLQLILGHKDISTTMRFYVHEEQRSLYDAITEVKL